MSDKCQPLFFDILHNRFTFAGIIYQTVTHMKRFLFLLSSWAFVLPITAQDTPEVSDSVRLNEVVVQGSRIINKGNGQLIYPSQVQKAASPTAYHLLARQPLSSLRIDPVNKTIVPLGDYGSVQLRINDIEASAKDVSALEVGSIDHIEYIDRPSVRYGNDVGFVINFIMKKPVSGYMLGADIRHSLTLLRGHADLFANFNKGKSEWSLSYEPAYNSDLPSKKREVADYTLADNSVYHVLRRDLHAKSRDNSHALQAKYSFADPTRAVFQAKVSTDIDHAPINDYEREVITPLRHQTAFMHIESSSLSPVFELYGHVKTDSLSSITSNLVGTYIRSRYAYQNIEQQTYAYSVKGRTASVVGEAIYDRRMTPFQLSIGTRMRYKYLSNDYSGDTRSHTTEHTSLLYLFAQLQGQLGRLSYIVGIGHSLQRYRQGTEIENYHLFCPKLTLSYPLFKGWKLHYSFAVTQKPPRAEYLSDVAVRLNEMDIRKGNPALRTDKRIEQNINLSGQSRLWNGGLSMLYRRNVHAVMQSIERTPAGFVFSRRNQRGCHMLLVQGNTSYDLIPDIWSFRVSGSILRCWNYGDNYKHHATSYMYTAATDLYVGRFTVSAYADNGWKFLEGENKGHYTGASYLALSYRRSRYTVSLYWQHCFQPHVSSMKSELLNRYLHANIRTTTRGMGNMVTLSLTWRLAKGRRYESVERKMNHRDDDNGIVK